MDLDIIDRTLWQVRELLTNDNVAGAIYLIKGLLPADQADVFEDLAPEQQQALLPEMDPDEAADILEEMEDEAASDLASQIAPEMLAYIVDEMEPDEAADLLGDLDPALSQATLAAMAEPEDVRPLLLHPDETAGGLMTSEYLAYPQQMRAGQVLSAIRQWPVRGHDSA
ncbi:MAG: magnesium transporter MgtE N-terminal domain-containing protein, partial [Anaerolineae bacterium]